MKLISFVLTILLSMVLIVLFFSLGPLAEGKLFPVYSHFTIVSADPDNEGVRVVFRYTKYRNCDPLGYQWYADDSDGLGPGVKVLNIKRIAPPNPKPLGTQLSNPIIIEGITPLELPNVRASIFSRCHPLWVTETIVRP